MPTDAQIRDADAALRAALALAGEPDPPDAYVQSILGVAGGESGYGVSGSWLMPPDEDGERRPSHNWGAVMCRPSLGPECLSHGDHDADGNPIGASFQAYPTAADGARGFLAVWGRPDTVAAARAGDAIGVARAMLAHGYYTGVKGTAEDRARAYAAMIHGMAARAAAATGRPLALRKPPAPTDGGGYMGMADDLAIGSGSGSGASVGLIAFTVIAMVGVFVGTLRGVGR